MSNYSSGYYLPCSTVSKRLCISTILSIILFALETTRLLDIAQDTIHMLSKSTLTITQCFPLGSKQYLFLIKGFVALVMMKLPASCSHSGGKSVRRLINKTLDQQACGLRCDSLQYNGHRKMSLKTQVPLSKTCWVTSSRRLWIALVMQKWTIKSFWTTLFSVRYVRG